MSAQNDSGMIQFVANYDDHSNDRGFQFQFHCDRCGNGFMSEFHASIAGIAGTALRTAGSLIGGWLGSASWNSYEVERTAYGPLRDAALRKRRARATQLPCWWRTAGIRLARPALPQP